MSIVPLDELRALFTGVPAEDNEWATAPCYTPALAFEIAKRCDTANESSLRMVLYDDTPSDQIPAKALAAITEAVRLYRTYRVHNRGRGL